MELAYKIHRRTTSNIHFMKGRPKDFVATVGSLLRPFRVEPGELIYQAGEPVLELYFLSKGSAEFVLPQCHDLPFMLLQEGDVFGVMDLVPATKQSRIEKEAQRHFSVMAKTRCEVLCLSLEHLALLKDKYPSAVDELFELAVVRLERAIRVRKEAISFYRSQKREAEEIGMISDKDREFGTRKTLRPSETGDNIRSNTNLLASCNFQVISI